MARLPLSKWFGAVLCFLSLLSLAQCDQCKRDDYKRYITPCDPKTRTRSVVYYLNRICKGGQTPLTPIHDIPCDCPPGKGMSGNLTSNKCVPCEIGYYGSGGEIINNWKDWTSNGTIPPRGSDIITFCEKSRDYVKECQSWTASADNFTLHSGDNSLARCMSSVLLITKKEFVMPDSKVSFEYRVDSRLCRSAGYLGCDGLAFFIDNQQMLGYQGNQYQWSTKTYNLTMGTHTLKWVFRKRCFSFLTSYVDKAFIRSITLVGTVEPTVTCKQCPPGFFSKKKGSSSCTPCSYFQYQSKEGQDRCEVCPPNTYAMLGASKCLPLPTCTKDDIITAPGELSTCSCTPSQNGLQCNTTLQPYYVTVEGLNGTRLLCNSSGLSSLKPEPYQCKCQPGFEIKKGGEKIQCKPCEKGQKSSGVKCEKCSPGHVALAGKHYYIWKNNTLPKGFTVNCAGDCSVKGGWIPSGHVIRTARVIGNVHSELLSPKFEVESELAKIVFNCSITCNLTGVAIKPTRGEHLANIKDCNLIFQVLDINNTVVDQANCTRPKGTWAFKHDTKRDGQVITHVYPLKKGTYSFRWVFHQEDKSRAFSTAFEGKLFNISVLGVPSGEAQNCTACPAGYHSISENTDCSICPNGTASSAGSEECKACDDGYFAAKEGSVTCLRCGNHTKSLPKKDGCTTNGCKFSPAPGVDYDLSKLSRPGGPMIEVVLQDRRSRSTPVGHRRYTIWPYQPSLYVNLCTLDHDNSSCTYRDKATGMKFPRPVMACRASWYVRDTDVGSVIGYEAKDDVRSGLIVNLLHGDKCYSGGKFSRYSTRLDLTCDVKAGVGNPGKEAKFTDILQDCQYRFLWKSLYACPKCRPSDVTKIYGECINGTRNITFLRSVPCWGTGQDTDVPTTPTTEECVMPTVTVRVPVNGTVTYVHLTKNSNKVNMALIGVGVVIILALLAVAGFFVYKHRVMKYRYYTLMARNKPMSRLEQEDDENNFITEDELAEQYDASIRT